jgi:hypothetical protein
VDKASREESGPVACCLYHSASGKGGAGIAKQESDMESRLLKTRWVEFGLKTESLFDSLVSLHTQSLVNAFDFFSLPRENHHAKVKERSSQTIPKPFEEIHGKTVPRTVSKTQDTHTLSRQTLPVS